MSWSPTSTTACRSSCRRQAYDRWLVDIEPDPRDLLVPFPAELMMMWPISTRVNKPENDDPEVLEPFEPVSGSTPTLL